jgi:predicted SprT family Zn-dependent metalloprotease
MTTTIIYTCGCQRKIETERPLTKEQRQAEREQRCPACRLHEPENVFGNSTEEKAGGWNF